MRNAKSNHNKEHEKIRGKGMPRELITMSFAFLREIGCSVKPFAMASWMPEPALVSSLRENHARWGGRQTDV
jgi:hypothetical protein